MIDSIFIALSGMQAHQRGLNIISNNVANLNTPGFHGSSASFADVFTGTATQAARDAALFGQSSTVGSGVDATRVVRDDEAGNKQQTGNPLDLFLDGEGFFVLQGEDGGTTYTRNGRFTLQNGALVAADLKSKVMARNADGALVPIDLAKLQLNPGKVTGTLTFTGNLESNDHDFTLSSVTVFDKNGAPHKLNIVFTKRDPVGTGTSPLVDWDIAISEGSDQIATSSIEFIAPTTLSDEKPTISLALKGVDPVSVTFDFTNLTNESTPTTGTPPDPTAPKQSTVALQTQDGFGTGSLTGETFDVNGVLKLTYSNGQTIDGPKLAFAEIPDLGATTEIGNSQFTYHGAQPAVLRAAGDDLKVVTGSLEGSNVDLTREFSELILMQRGYQASSEVLSTVNEMLQQLFDVRGQR